VSADAYDPLLSSFRRRVKVLSTLLGIWSCRAEPDASARLCASDAIGAIDAMLADPHLIRERLVSEIRAADDASAARADELLRRGVDPLAR
jgi:hypothetical protein